MVGPELCSRILPILLLVCSQQALGWHLGEVHGGRGVVLGLSGPRSCANTRDISAAAGARMYPEAGAGHRKQGRLCLLLFAASSACGMRRSFSPLSGGSCYQHNLFQTRRERLLHSQLWD